MGLTIKAEGANFESNPVSFIPPVRDGLLYWGFTNESLEKLGKNFAPNGSPVAVVGQPTVDGKCVTLGEEKYVNTGIVQTPSLTIICVGHPVTDGAEVGMFVSNFSGNRPGGKAGKSFGVSLYCGFNDVNPGVFEVRASVARFSGESGSGSGLNYVLLPNLDITKPAFLAMTFDGNEKVVRAYELSTGVSGQRPAIPDFVDMATTPFYVGDCPESTWVNNPRKIYFTAIYNRKLSEPELDTIYKRIKAYLATRGVIV